MKFSQASGAGHQVKSYEPGRLRIGERTLTHNLFLTAARLERWDVAGVDTLEADDFAPMLALRPDVILLGTGPDQRFPPRIVYRHLAQEQVGLEVMGTAAAARTFNVLVAEGRHVVAALIV